jgi:caa(3)-type oxidase subunit IV
MASSPEEIKKHLKTYLYVGAFLFFMTAFTVFIAQFEFQNRALQWTVGLGIAAFKAITVALIFMHLNSERGLIYKILVFAGVFFTSMMFLFVLSQRDPVPFEGPSAHAQMDNK